MKIMTKQNLRDAAAAGIRRGYSRQIGTDLVESLPEGARFPVLASALRDYVQGVRGKPYVRAIVAVGPKETWQIDINADTFDSLPEEEEVI